MDHRYSPEVRRLNRLLASELGSNPRYSWRWSEDLRHVMFVCDPDGNPEYIDRPIYVPTKESADRRDGMTVLYSRVRKTAVRNLLPFHKDVWVCCALVEVDEKDGELEQTGNANWIPLSSSLSGPAALPPGVKPDVELTQAIIISVRRERALPPGHLDDGFEEAQRKREKDRWNRAYDCIKDAATAFYNMPGQKGHVSFPSIIH